MRKSLLVAVAAGTAAGVLWLVVYGRAVPLAGVVLGAHVAAALAVVAGLRVLGPAAARPLPVLGAVLVSLLAVPALLAPYYRATLLWGLRGLVIDAACLTAGVLVGAGIGLALNGGPVRRTAGTAALLACIAAPLVVSQHFAVPRGAAARLAQRVTDHFPTRPLVVVGFDGGDWGVAGPLMAAGKLPNLARVVKEGQHGVLQSIEPLSSPVVWSSMFTGQPPRVHGISGWYDADRRNLRAAPLWDLFSAHGQSALVINVPGTWPPARLDGVAVVAGMPVPWLDAWAIEMPVGTVASTEEENGAVPTRRLAPAADGSWRVDLHLGAVPREAPSLDLHNLFLEMLIKHRPPQVGRWFEVPARFAAEGVALSGVTLTRPVVLPVDGTPRWVSVQAGELDAVLLASVLEASPTRMRLYFSQPITAPWNPHPPFAAGLPDDLLADRERPYVVEGPGWVARRDRRLDGVLAEQILEVERNHGDLAVASIQRLDPQLVAIVVTVTDRLQHAYLPFHAPPGGEPAVPPPPLLGGRDPVDAAYELADAILGRVRAAMPPDSLVWVVSDHGFEVDPDLTKGRHRLEGMWAACGPGVAPGAEPVSLGVLDLLPSVLHCLGVPPAEDLAGRAAGGLCPDAERLAPVASYTAPSGGGGPTEHIDEAREQQLRSLGYLE